MNPQSLIGRNLKNYACKKCGGILEEIYDPNTGYIIRCSNRCYPLEVETMTQKTLREFRNMEDASKVEQNYPELAPKRMTKEQIERSMNALFPKE